MPYHHGVSDITSKPLKSTRREAKHCTTYRSLKKRWHLVHHRSLLNVNIQNTTLHFRNFFRWDRSPQESTKRKHLCKCCSRKCYKFIIIINNYDNKQDARYNVKIIYNKATINSYKKNSHCYKYFKRKRISEASSDETANLKKVSMENICVTCMN